MFVQTIITGSIRELAFEVGTAVTVVSFNSNSGWVVILRNDAKSPSQGVQLNDSPIIGFQILKFIHITLKSFDLVSNRYQSFPLYHQSKRGNKYSSYNVW